MPALVQLIRPAHWIKNLFLLIPLFFAGNLFQIERLVAVGAGMIAFCLVSSGIYILNDIKDRETDKLHPLKKDRPLAAGTITVTAAIPLMLVLLLSGLAISILINTYFLILLGSYILLNVGYSFGLRNIPIVDLFIVSLGFILRIHSGGILAEVEVSHWLTIMVMLLSLFLVLARRRDDLVLQSASHSVIRKTSSSYNIEFIDVCLTIFAGVIVVAYIMYTVSPEVNQKFNSPYLFTTTLFVIAGIMRYLQIALVEKNSGSPTRILFKDTFLIVTILSWVISFYFIIYY